MSSLRVAVFNTEVADRAVAGYHAVSSSPVYEAVYAGRALYRALNINDPQYAAWRQKLWWTYTRLTLSLLPPNDPRLQLNLIVDELLRDRTLQSDSPDLLQRLKCAMDVVLSVPSNPKLDFIKEHWGSLDDRPNSAALLSAVSSRPAVEGWPPGASESVRSDLPRFQFVTSLAELRAHAPDLLIVPAGGRGFPAGQLAQLHCSGLARNIAFVAYDLEKFAAYTRPTWIGGRQLLPFRRAESAPPDSVTSQDEGSPEINDPNWSELRRIGLTASDSGDDLIVEGRWVIFESGQAVCLPEDSAVPELSDLIDNPHDDGSTALPRCNVSSLRLGQVLLLRTSGSGEYLDAVADALMKAAHNESLRTDTNIWRNALGAALRVHSLQSVRQWLAATPGIATQQWFSLSHYASSLIIGPNSYDRFSSLIHALIRNHYLPADTSEQFIRDHWARIEHIRSYQKQAGQTIRRELLNHLRLKLKNREPLIGRAISLPGVDGGDMSLLRIAAVDDSSTSVAATRLYRLIE